MRFRPLLLATIFGATVLPCLADPAPMATGSGLRGVQHPSPIAGGGAVPLHMAHDGPTIQPTLRHGDVRVEAARRAAEARKIKSVEK